MDEDVHLGMCADCDGEVRKKPLYCESSDTCRRKLKGEGWCSECGEATFLCITCQLRRARSRVSTGKSRIPRAKQDDFQRRTRATRSTFVCTKCMQRCALRSTCGDREPEREDCPFGFEASWFRSRGRVKSR